MKKVLLSVAALALAGSFTNAVSAPTKAAVCAGCHGANGISLVPMYPNLAGQKEQYLVKQMNAFKDGTRKDPIMGPQAATLSPAEIAELSKYYAEMK